MIDCFSNVIWCLMNLSFDTTELLRVAQGMKCTRGLVQCLTKVFVICEASVVGLSEERFPYKTPTITAGELSKGN